jgi:hypothetical protein
MATYTNKAYNGTTGVFEYEITFPYARGADIFVYVEDAPDTDWVFSNDGASIIWETPLEPQDGESFVIKRVTDISDAAVIYTNGSGFVHTDINTALNQLLYSVDELQVAAYDSGWNLGADIEASGVDEANNLGAVPTRWQISLWCTSSDAGYTTNDIVEFHSMGEAPLIWWTSTNLRMETGAASWTIAHGTTAVQTAIDTSKWKFRVQAWR